jgi:hypothetical protein
MRIIPRLTSLNCFMVVMHTMNVGLMRDGLKDREGRNKKSSREWIIFVSARKDVAGPLKWESDPGIKSGYMYVVAYITGYEDGQDYIYNWQLEIYPITHPIKCPPVGQGPRSPRAAHASALAALAIQLDDMTLRGCMSRVWSFGDEPTAFCDQRNTFYIPTDVVQCYTSATHKEWSGMCSSGQQMWYKVVKDEPVMDWGYREGTEYVQVKVIGHMYLHNAGVSVRVFLCICERPMY